jgi:hypothetical protein
MGVAGLQSAFRGCWIDGSLGSAPTANLRHVERWYLPKTLSLLLSCPFPENR